MGTVKIMFWGIFDIAAAHAHNNITLYLINYSTNRAQICCVGYMDPVEANACVILIHVSTAHARNIISLYLMNYSFD